VAAEEAEATVHYLREREQATSVYLERRLPVRLDDGRVVKALSYVADRRHEQYAGRLSFDEVLRLVRQGRGVSGFNPDYVRSTHEHLLGMGIVDPLLHRITGSLD
jgi:cation transport protein ChaC